MDTRIAGAQSIPTLPAVPAAQPAAWQVVGAVVRGVSHERLGMPCQDAQDYRLLPGGILLVALADGAGSAAFSDQGARAAVNEALHALAGSFEPGLPADNEAWQALLRDVFAGARAAVLRLAETNVKEGVDPKAATRLPDEPEGFQDPAAAAPEEDEAALDFAEFEEPEISPVPGQPGRAYATTLTCAVVTAGQLVVGQIGDGVVVAGEGADLFTVTHLQRGEYANETHFLTQVDALDHLAIEIVDRPVSALAVMSDGLIRLALKMPAQEPHEPFFQPLFRVTAAMQDAAEVARQLSAFLGSERVNARTDDDKSLVLAVRVESHRVSGETPKNGEGTLAEGRLARAAGSAKTGAGDPGPANGIEGSQSSPDRETG
ncbi:MAG: protein phosphatase 2C domain-containing protein [Chloroflexi bacterium]|nr:MAG: protein phosphatase 2C domain-containing protein [Chloroflexota bacterium]